MRNIIIILIGICFLQSSCKKQNDSKSDLNINTKEIPKKLDPEKILMFQSLDKHEYIDNDTLFILKDFGNVYRYIAKPIHSNFEKHLVYDAKSFKIKNEGCFFSKMAIGIHKFYDENGNLIKEIDYDKDYNFSVDDLIEKVKKEFKIDLNKNLKRIEIRRRLTQTFNFPLYNINVILISPDSSYLKSRKITIDGKFGFITSDKTYTITED